MYLIKYRCEIKNNIVKNYVHVYPIEIVWKFQTHSMRSIDPTLRPEAEPLVMHASDVSNVKF